MKQKAYDYGECHVCGGKMSEQIVKQEFWLKDQLVVIDELPAGVCEQCGEIYFEPGGAEKVAQAVNCLFALAFAERQHKGRVSAHLS